MDDLGNSKILTQSWILRGRRGRMIVLNLQRPSCGGNNGIPPCFINFKKERSWETTS